MRDDDSVRTALNIDDDVLQVAKELGQPPGDLPSRELAVDLLRN